LSQRIAGSERVQSQSQPFVTFQRIDKDNMPRDKENEKAIYHKY